MHHSDLEHRNHQKSLHLSVFWSGRFESQSLQRILGCRAGSVHDFQNGFFGFQSKSSDRQSIRKSDLRRERPTFDVWKRELCDGMSGGTHISENST
jgi:hypothetical protein